MLKKEITYPDFDGKEITNTFYFHLTRIEVAELNLIEDIKEVGKSEDPKKILPVLKNIIRYSVGQKMNGLFVKPEAYAMAFVASEAYTELIVGLLSSDDTEKKTVEFIRSILPSDLNWNELEKEIQEKNREDSVAS